MQTIWPTGSPGGRSPAPVGRGEVARVNGILGEIFYWDGVMIRVLGFIRYDILPVKRGEVGVNSPIEMHSCIDWVDFFV